MTTEKPFSPSCVENRVPILRVLQPRLSGRSRLLEIGSGTGQHAVYFAPELSHLHWQTSDCRDQHAGIQAWLEEAALPNVAPPLALDVLEDDWPDATFDAVFSANTAHIMSWSQVECFIHGVGRVLQTDGVLCLYGPFNYNGRYTSESNARFDSWLKSRDPLSGVRDFAALDELARTAGLVFKRDYAMPANNRTLVWSKPS